MFSENIHQEKIRDFLFIFVGLKGIFFFPETIYETPDHTRRHKLNLIKYAFD